MHVKSVSPQASKLIRLVAAKVDICSWTRPISIRVLLCLFFFFFFFGTLFCVAKTDCTLAVLRISFT